MALELLLKPLKIVDEGIQKRYTKLGKKWEDQGHSRYSIAMPLTAYAAITGSIVGLYSDLTFGFFIWDMWSNLTKRPYGTGEEGLSDVIDRCPVQEVFKKVDRTVRLPLFIAGLGYMSKALYGVADSMISGDNSGFVNFASDFTVGSSLFAMASSLYIKDIEPKLLDKEPFLKKAYNWVKDKVISSVPQPLPEPVPS